ncbi:M56 family metallopeptidase [Ilumatobacter nonamiensis]|uniref:M56 family metallopeptidase n=1 Tax=Ilumatobacter nonamiensis TaxID=467093 RepID=UPI000347C4C6|nr:M56 family metallopeptidase [Ilumatobacter nonamiensis]
MINFVALPLVVTFAIAAVGSRILERLRPSTAARSSTILLTAVSVATVPTLWLIGLSGLAHLGLQNPVVEWCRHLLPTYRPVGAVVGLASLAVAVIGTVRAVRVLRLHRRVRCADTSPLEIVDTDEVYAYTLPGPAATIAVSTGLRAALDADELDIVMAHEQVHARHRHDRYKLLGLLASALVPPTRRMAARLDYHLERWADEEALENTGAERRLAARTIAKVALAGSGPTLALGIAGHGVAARASALLAPAEQPTGTARIQSLLTIAVTVALAGYQLHHSAMFAGDLLH